MKKSRLAALTLLGCFGITLFLAACANPSQAKAETAAVRTVQILVGESSGSGAKDLNPSVSGIHYVYVLASSLVGGSSIGGSSLSYDTETGFWTGSITIPDSASGYIVFKASAYAAEGDSLAYVGQTTVDVEGDLRGNEALTIPMAAASSAKAITAFSFPAVTWNAILYNTNHQNGNDLGTAISGTSITAKLPYGPTAMVASFTTTGASVTVGGLAQVSGVTSNDFKNPVTYRVTAEDGSTQDYTVTALFVPEIGSNLVPAMSSYWSAATATSDEADSLAFGWTCDAINAGAGIFTMKFLVNDGSFFPFAPGTGSGPYLNVPTDTTVTSIGGDNCLQIVGPLTSIQSVISQVLYIPPNYGGVDDEMGITLTDKYGLRAYANLIITVTAP